jgi:hypothetical protein
MLFYMLILLIFSFNELNNSTILLTMVSPSSFNFNDTLASNCPYSFLLLSSKSWNLLLNSYWLSSSFPPKLDSITTSLPLIYFLSALIWPSQFSDYNSSKFFSLIMIRYYDSLKISFLSNRASFSTTSLTFSLIYKLVMFSRTLPKVSPMIAIKRLRRTSTTNNVAIKNTNHTIITSTE